MPIKKNTVYRISTVFIVFYFFSFQCMAQNKATQSLVEKNIDADNERLTAIFKDIHQNPELGFMEFRTAGILAKELKGLGYDVKEGIGKTGVAGILKNGNGPIVMYRADMDCNTVKETTGVPYASTKVAKLDDGSETPVMHACGHDAHVTWLIGVAKFMAEHKNLWKGTLVLIGQPAEEPILGAEAMVNDGLYTKYGVPQPDYLFGLHTAPIAIGMVIVASGVRMAGTDQFDVTFSGIGGHGSSPHLTKDPIVMAASAIMQYQVIVSRGIDPKHSAVVTVGSVQAGSDNNVIPASSLLKVNLRWFEEKDRKLIIDGIKRINDAIAYSYDLPKELYPKTKMKGWSYPLDNEPGLTQTIQKGLSGIVNPKYLLKEDVVESVMGSEDFHHLVIHNEKKAYCYINVGVADPKRFEKAVKETGNFPYHNHNGDYVVDLAAIPYGTKVAALGVLSIFNK